MSALIRKHWRPLAAVTALFLLNAYICRELFVMEFMRNVDSNEGAFVALSRFFRENFSDQRWFPLFNGGVPIENAYQPLLPVLAAATGWVTGWSVERAFHFVLALAYCLGPVTLFWFAWEWSRSVVLGLSASLAYSLTSFAELLIPILRVQTDSHWVSLRLYNLIHYAEDPHNVALTLLPLALLFLKRAITERNWLNVTGAVLWSAFVVLTNAFGAVDLLIGGICIVLALNRGTGTLVITGVAAWFLMCPWLPPSLIVRIAGGQWNAGLTSSLLFAALVGASVVAWVATRGWRPLERFSVLFAPWMCAFPMAYFLLGITLVPQGNRYQLELEMALCLVLGCLCACGLASVRFEWQGILILLLVLFCARQTKIFRHAARSLIQPVEITQTIEYKMVHWLDRNLPGQRSMISGDVQFLNNVISNNPQLGGGHEPTVPNWMDLVAIFTIYTGQGAGPRDAEYSIFWLKAFGVQAITVSGGQSREHYHAIAHPHKFDGILPVLWHEEDDTIFAVPQRSKSLAHVIPKDAVCRRRPIHGVDIDPVRAYVTALDDAHLPMADLKWNGNSGFSVRAPFQSGRVLSIQVTYAPGWSATVGGHPIPLHADGIGLMVAEPDCEGDCKVEFVYGVTSEAWVCRILSASVMLALTVFGISAAVRKVRSRQLLPH